MDKSLIVHNELCVQVYCYGSTHYVRLYNMEAETETWCYVRTNRNGNRIKYYFDPHKSDMTEEHKYKALWFMERNRNFIVHLLNSNQPMYKGYEPEHYEEFVHKLDEDIPKEIYFND